MGLYAIGIGGTGAKCVESLLHLAAAGTLQDNESLYILFADPDRSNGNLARTEKLLATYSNCRSDRLSPSPFLKTEVRVADEAKWSPLTESSNALKDYFQLGSLESTHTEISEVFKVLFTEEERETPLDKGFRGHPSIGAAVTATSVDFEDREPWSTFWGKIDQDIKAGEDVRVILFGSIFGGTGASGFPTIGRLLRRRFADLKQTGTGQAKLGLGGVLMLPYFSFDPVKSKEMKADSQDFLLNTQAALHYYYQREKSNMLSKAGSTFDTTYLIGAQDQRNMHTSELGGEAQINDAHYAELYAALSAVDFFKNDSFDQQRKYRFVGRKDSTSLSYTDLPYVSHTLLRDRMNNLARFSFAYLSTYYPMLASIARETSKAYSAPWYVEFFESRGVRAADRLPKELEHVRQYCEYYLEWLANVDFSVTGTATITGSLIDYSAFAFVGQGSGKPRVELVGKDNQRGFYLDGFEKIEISGMDEKRRGLTSLWNKMCDSYPSGNHRTAWEFFTALYNHCGNSNSGQPK